MDCIAVLTSTLLSSFGDMIGATLGFLRILGAEAVGNLLNLDTNADALDREMRQLKEDRDDLENRVRILELEPRMRRTHRASGWLERVDDLNGEVRSCLNSWAIRSAILGSCSFDSLHSGWVLGGRVADLLKRVRELRGQSGDLASCLVDEAQPDPVVAVPTETALIIGGEEDLSTIRRYLKNENVGLIGIYGMGGVGKTTLLSKLNNQYHSTMETIDFEVVIWVTISKDRNLKKVQEDIGARLGFSRPGGDRQGHRPLPENEDDRRDTLYSALNQKRFLLLLDDMWEKLELGKIGIPHPNEGKKIVFTTRSEEVCADMGAQQAKIKVGFLKWEDSWTLFRSHLDPRVDLDSNREMQSLAEIVVRKCGGLPLALITMGRAMSNATRIGEWRQAVDQLRSSPDKIRGMEDVLSLLKFSFDRLDDDITRECLLYCALFPEDYDIRIDVLVDYWVGEGFLDANSSDSGHLLEARDSGDCIIGKLIYSCLLESGKTDRNVKMHDVVREMAIWLTGEASDKRNKFVVCDSKKALAQLTEAKLWEDAKGISIFMQEVCTFQLPPLASHCHNLSTVLISSNMTGVHIKQLVITQSFCESMPALRVLDLSGTDVEEIPDAVGLLTELRYLNLRGTRIRQLPKSLGKLVKLRYLDLRFTRKLLQVPREAILTLTRLQRLEIEGSAYQWDDDGGDASGGAKLSDVGWHLCRLEELSVDIYTKSCLQVLVNSETLRKSAIRVMLRIKVDLTSPRLSEALDRLDGLKWLQIEGCPTLDVWRVNCCNQLMKLVGLTLFELEQLKDIVVETDEVSHIIPQGGGRGHIAGRDLVPPFFPSLSKLWIHSCHKLKDLRWIGQLPHLRSLSLYECDGLEELLVGDHEQSTTGEEADNDDDDNGASFPRLEFMYLVDLPALRSISMKPLLFPSLQLVQLFRCPRLKRLPLGGHDRSCNKIREIIADQEWWDALEWDDYDPNSRRSCIKSKLDPFLSKLDPLPAKFNRTT